MASSSIPSSGSQKSASSEQYEVPLRTLLTPVKNIEVMYELIVDFNSLKENGFDLSKEIKLKVGKSILTGWWVQHFLFW